MNSDHPQNSPERPPDGDDLSRRLADYDDALASGNRPGLPELGEDVDLLHLLNRLRPARPAPESERALPTTGPDPDARYVLRGLRAVGGVGEIWLARDTELERDVALKVLRPDRAADPAFEARFLHEARVTARLQHPGIVPVYDLVPRPDDPAGDAGQPTFYTMRLVPGRTLAEAAQAFHARRDAGLLALNALLTAFVSVCQTVAYAHSRGVIHRDLKPQNVALGQFGEVVVLDWGLAREDGDEEHDRPSPTAAIHSPLATRHGDVLGTPAYMAPEQAVGHTGRIDPRTDVHGLGAILYEILTGRPPFQGTDTGEVLRQAREADPPPPRSVWPGAPPALEAVCLKALDREPARRYGSAAEVAREVQHWLADEPVAAYPEPMSERVRRWARHHRPLLAGASALLLTAAFAGGAALVLVRQEQARTAEARAQAAFEKVEANERADRDVKKQLYFHRVALAERTLAAHNPSRAFQLLALCPPEFRDWEWHCLKRYCQAGVPTLRNHDGTVLTVAFSPDGRWLASASFDGPVRLWDAANLRPVLTLAGHEGVVYHLAFSPDGHQLATAGWDHTARVWAVETGRQVYELRGHTAPVNRVAFSLDGRRLATLANDHTIGLWDALTGEPVRMLPARIDPVWSANHVTFSPDSRLLALTGPDKTVRLWDADSGDEVRRFEGHRAVTRAVAFSPDGRWLASGDGEIGRADGGEVRVWEVQTGACVRAFQGHSDPVYDVTFSPDGHRLVSASADQTVKLWDLVAGQEALTLHAHTDVVRSAAFSPDGLRLATAGADRAIRIWDATPWSDAVPARQKLTLQGPEGRLFGVAVRPDGRRWAAVGEYAIRVWADEAESATHELSKVDYFAVAFRPGGAELATAGSDGVVMLLDTATGKRGKMFSGHAGGPIKGLAFSPDGRLLASAGWDRTARVWDVAAGEPRHLLRGHQEPVLGVAFSPDGRHLATASSDRTIKVWDVTTGEKERTLVGHGGGVTAVCFSPAGNVLASAGTDGTVRLWAVADWREVSKSHGHVAAVRGLAFSPDGKLLASGGDDWTVRLWRAATGDELATLRGHTGRVSGVAFTPDGPGLISTSFDGTVKVWAVADLAN